MFWTNNISVKTVIVLCLFNCIECYHHRPQKVNKRGVLNEVLAWKQISYDFDGVKYVNSTDLRQSPGASSGDVSEADAFFAPYNNVPIGFAVYKDRVFITVPRRRHGIPSTLNYLSLTSGSRALKPYPSTSAVSALVSVYRPRVDVCGRLWAVDTGMLEVPGGRRQLQPPAIVMFDLETDQQILRYQLKDADLVDERTPAGLTSITVEVERQACGDAFAYLTDLATGGVVVFSLRRRASWRLAHPSFQYEEAARNFTVAGHTIDWKDGIFSLVLSPGAPGGRTAFYHALVSEKEYSVDTRYLRDGGAALDQHVKLVGTRGPLTQSGSSDFHAGTGMLFLAAVVQDAILCWPASRALVPANVGVFQDRKRLVYISDLKVVGDEVWALVNQMPRFIYSTLDPGEKNYFLYRANVYDLIRGTACDPRQRK